MNPFDTFLLFRSRGFATALIEAFASVKAMQDSDPEAARLALRAIALSLPPTTEWSGLVRELEALSQPQRGAARPLVLSDAERDSVKARLDELHRRAAAAPDGWSDELEAELDALMSSLARNS